MTMPEGWLLDQDRFWAMRFHRDEKSWIRDPKVFVDLGREMARGEAPLLKSRRHLRREQAEGLWKDLVRSGWQPTTPLWGSSVEP